MPKGEGPKGGGRECKVCKHAGRAEIEAMILNATQYSAIIARMKQLHPEEPVLIPSNLTNHKKDHLLNQPITVTTEDGQQQTYLTGHYRAGNIRIPKDAVPEIPSIEEGLRILVGIGLHNALNNPNLVTPQVTLAALQELRKMGAGRGETDELLGAWAGVKNAKDELIKKARRTKRTVTVSEETLEAEGLASPAEEPVDAVEAVWSAEEAESLALPAPQEDESA